MAAKALGSEERADLGLKVLYTRIGEELGGGEEEYQQNSHVS